MEANKIIEYINDKFTRAYDMAQICENSQGFSDEILRKTNFEMEFYMQLEYEFLDRFPYHTVLTLSDFHGFIFGLIQAECSLAGLGKAKETAELQKFHENVVEIFG